MAQPRRNCAVGDYVVGKQIGAGSFSTVWHARHRFHGTEVAIKEIVTARLNPKLQESLKSEIVILKRINHPNIIRLHDMIEEPGKMYIILEYCKGGDLSMYILQRKGRVPEATAKHFMQQLAEGLKVLRENNLIHRDLKPQNLLLSTNSDNSALKIADFGFARSLEDTNLAETLCGSPLYMAPEIMRFQKYDAKADLWSVGAILFQLVTGRTPFTGNNQIQLLQNIIKSTDLQFPPEAQDLSPDCIDLCKKLLQYNPALRLRFEEFFNHPFLSQRQPEKPPRNNHSQTVLDGFPLPERGAEQSSQEDCLTFRLDYDSPVPDGNLIFPKKSMYGFDSNPDLRNLSNLAQETDTSKYRESPPKKEITGSRLGSRRFSEGNLKKSLQTMDLGLVDNRSKVLDSLETIVQDYVIVSGSQIDLSKPSHFPSKNTKMVPSSPVSIIRGASGRVDYPGSVESQLSAPGTSHESADIADTFEQPSTDYMTRINSLQCAAAAITELVNNKIEAGKQMEAFSVQLVILAIRKQALHICHTHAASAMEGSPNQESPDICSQIERAFLHEVEHAEELAKEVEPGNMEMPDAMELIYQSALDLGKHGAVSEYMGDMESAVVLYTKAVRLLVFVLVEAPCLILNPPFSLTNTDRYRIKNYIDVLNNRQSISRSQRMAILRAD